MDQEDQVDWLEVCWVAVVLATVSEMESIVSSPSTLGAFQCLMPFPFSTEGSTVIKGQGNSINKLLDVGVPILANVNLLNNVLGSITGISGKNVPAQDRVEVVNPNGEVVMQIAHPNSNQNVAGNSISNTINRKFHLGYTLYSY